MTGRDDETARASLRHRTPPRSQWRSDDEMRRLRDAALAVHQMGCERCALLAILCPECRKAFGECTMRIQIERLPVGAEPGEERTA